MLRSENGRPTTWIYVASRGRDLVSVVDDLQGAKQRLAVVVPATLLIIFVLLYLTFDRFGVVKAIDNAAGTITLAHEAIRTAKWAAMTMAFGAPLDARQRVSVGDDVRFALWLTGGSGDIVSIENNRDQPITSYTLKREEPDMVNGTMEMPRGMMIGMGLFWIVVIAFLILGIAAFIKYLRSK